MSRRISTKKRFPENDFQYESVLVSILINKVLRKGKKQLAKRIVYKALEIVKDRSKKSPLLVLEQAIRKMAPRVQLKATRVGGASYQIPTPITAFRSVNLAVSWAVRFAKKRGGKGAANHLAGEIMDGAKGIGGAVKKREEMHKAAEANKAFIHLKKAANELQHPED